MNSGILATFGGLSGALLEHLMALFSLAGLETKEFFKKSLIAVLIFLALLLFLLIGYLLLLGMCLTLAVVVFHCSWPWALGGATLFHFLIAGLLVVFLRRQRLHEPLPLTRLEIQRDIESLQKNTTR